MQNALLSQWMLWMLLVPRSRAVLLFMECLVQLDTSVLTVLAASCYAPTDSSGGEISNGIAK